MNISNILKELGIEAEGRYENKFYVIDLADSDEYSEMYSRLDSITINTESPSIQTNSNNTTVKITNYFELEDEGKIYNIFLIANFKDNEYYLKIGEK
jgi:hypothetical protein